MNHLNHYTKTIIKRSREKLHKDTLDELVNHLASDWFNVSISRVLTSGGEYFNLTVPQLKQVCQELQDRMLRKRKKGQSTNTKFSRMKKHQLVSWICRELDLRTVITIDMDVKLKQFEEAFHAVEILGEKLYSVTRDRNTIKIHCIGDPTSYGYMGTISIDSNFVVAVDCHTPEDKETINTVLDTIHYPIDDFDYRYDREEIWQQQKGSGTMSNHLAKKILAHLIATDGDNDYATSQIAGHNHGLALTVKSLRQVARAAGIPTPSKLSRKQLVSKIIEKVHIKKKAVGLGG